MRVMMKASFPVEAGNRAIADGTIAKTIQSAFESLKPEAAYFFPEGGKRTALFVFDLVDASQIPVVAEPLFMGMNASVDIIPVMNIDDLKKGLGQMAKRM
ncbi:MAG: hypothetical protein HY660_01575 [Armatimonadetes bacterium]|nr:hypothetical protein [Armatimonadota bacterium]